MAYIGMRHVVAATVRTEVKGSPLEYNAGMVVGYAIQGNLTWERADNPLHGDDVVVENDNGVTGGTLEIGTDDLLEAVRAYMLGLVQHSGQDTHIYETTEDPAPYVGIGYMRVRRKRGVTSFQAIWYHKAMFGETNENSQTKGQNIEWQTPTITGRIMGVYNDNSGMANFRTEAYFATEAEATAWLDAKANITAQAGD